MRQIVIAAVVACLSAKAEMNVTGLVAPSATVQVKPLITGTLTKTFILGGQLVRSGDLLFEIKAPEYEFALAQAQGAVERDTAQLKQAEAILARDQLAGGSRAADVQQQTIRADQAAVEAAKTTIQIDKIAVEKAKTDLAHTRIFAPISGYVGELPVDAGNVVKAGETVLAVIMQLQPVLVTFELPHQFWSALLGRIDPVSIRVSRKGDSTKTFEGKVTFIEKIADPRSDGIRLKASVPNPALYLWPGNVVDVWIALDKEK